MEAKLLYTYIDWPMPIFKENYSYSRGNNQPVQVAVILSLHK